MKDKYFLQQLLLAFHQAAVTAYLCMMAAAGNFIESGSKAHIVLLSLLFGDAAYISCRNIQNSRILRNFSYLLLLTGWQFLLSLFRGHSLSAELSEFLLPICLYQTFYFLQAFLFQASAYKWQKPFLMACQIALVLSAVGFVVSDRAFAIAYQLQSALSVAAAIFLGTVHRRRISFVLQSHRQELFHSLLFAVLPFLFYAAAFHKNTGYLENMGSFFLATLTFLSVHNIAFQPPRQQFFALQKEFAAILVALGFAGLALTARLFGIPLTAIFLFVQIVILLAVLSHLFFYVQIHGANCKNPAGGGHYYAFYAYSLAQLRREEALKKDFANYLHDEVLQDLLSVKNLAQKAGQPAVQQLMADTLNGLAASIRSQMQAYHPVLLKSLTLKENLQCLLDTLAEHSPMAVTLDCSDTVFLVEPYNILIYRMIRELTANALKHAEATSLHVLLVQEQGMISLKVSDNGKGFEIPNSHQPGHRGIASIQEQVCLLDGTMDMHSVPGAGTQVTVTIPMKGKDSYESFINR